MLEHTPESGAASHPRILIIDPHGEYSHAFKDRAIVYRAYDPLGNEEDVGVPISLPYWLMSADEFRTLVIGKTEYEATSQNNIIYKAITYARMVAANLVDPSPTAHGEEAPTDGIDHDAPRPKEGVTIEQLIEFDHDKPRPFSLQEFYNHIFYLQAARVQTEHFKPFRLLILPTGLIHLGQTFSFTTGPKDSFHDAGFDRSESFA